MSDEYGLWVWDATGKPRFGIYGRYFRFHSRYTIALPTAQGSYSYSFSIPGASADGTWSVNCHGGNGFTGKYGVFSADLLTIHVNKRISAAGMTLTVEVYRG